MFYRALNVLAGALLGMLGMFGACALIEATFHVSADSNLTNAAAPIGALLGMALAYAWNLKRADQT
jgi:hypothetical protein